MLTVDYDRLGVGAGTKVIDVGCGAGRHSYEAYRRGADVIAFDQNAEELAEVDTMLQAMGQAGEAPAAAKAQVVVGDALALPYPDGTFDVVIASEILEHVPDDDTAIAELVRVLRPGGRLAITVPRWLTEKICWLLSDSYHANEGGHIRIYRADQLRSKLQRRGMTVTGFHHAHALHSPYWWLKCAVGPRRTDVAAVNRYQRLLEWEITEQPAGMQVLERTLAPVLGKSLIVYGKKR